MRAFNSRRSYPTVAVTDEYSARVLDDAVDQLIMLRAPMHHGDAGAQLHALVSLVAQAKVRLPGVVADARDQEHTWSAIAHQLSVTRLAAMCRFALHINGRRTPLDVD